MSTQKWGLTTLIAHFDTVQCFIDNLTIFFRFDEDSKATMKRTNAKVFKAPYCISKVHSRKSSGKRWQKTQAHLYDVVFTATVSKFRTLSLIILNLAVKLILMVDKIKDSLIIIFKTFRLGH